ncbi:MAG: CcmD family protein [Clostridia bacterium]|jgi:CcmD family protein|nr:CcmD family protein [Clostridia bacterium]
MNYLFAAYTVIWVLLFGYLVTLGKRQNKLAEELEILKRNL